SQKQSELSRPVAHLLGYSVVASKERLNSSDNIIVVVYLPDQTPLSKGRWPRGRRRCTGSSIRVATPTQTPTCTARALPFFRAAACRAGAVARSGKKRARIRSA